MPKLLPTMPVHVQACLSALVHRALDRLEVSMIFIAHESKCRGTRIPFSSHGSRSRDLAQIRNVCTDKGFIRQLTYVAVESTFKHCIVAEENGIIKSAIARVGNLIIYV